MHQGQHDDGEPQELEEDAQQAHGLLAPVTQGQPVDPQVEQVLHRADLPLHPLAPECLDGLHRVRVGADVRRDLTDVAEFPDAVGQFEVFNLGGVDPRPLTVVPGSDLPQDGVVDGTAGACQDARPSPAQERDVGPCRELCLLQPAQHTGILHGEFRRRPTQRLRGTRPVGSEFLCPGCQRVQSAAQCLRPGRPRRPRPARTPPRPGSAPRTCGVRAGAIP